MKFKTHSLSHVFLAGALLSIIHHQLTTVFAQGTAFACQERLNDGDNPAIRTHELLFTMYDFASGGSAVAGPLVNSATGVTNELFTVALDWE
jgi:hypothetical protein